MENKLKVLAIVGPTAAGKSKLAVDLAVQFNGIVISADSRQIYKGMDIATTKITKDEMQGVPHYMLSIIEPNKTFNVNTYQKTVTNLLEKIHSQNQSAHKPILPILVGGTGMYIDAVVEGWTLPHVPPNLKLRAELEGKSTEELAKKVRAMNPNIEVDFKNKRRLIRLLEIYSAGVSRTRTVNRRFDVLKLGVYKDKDWITERIHQRVQSLDMDMLIKETKRLIKKGYSFKHSALSAMGYDLARDHIQGGLELSELKDQLELMHKQYAKRQMTWFKRDKDIHWLSDLKSAKVLVERWLG